MSRAVDKSPSQMVFNVQVLRAVASLLVVHAHAAGSAGLHLSWAGGTNGVDLFFVISGFIIAYVADLDPDRFMTRRLIRIVPIYWASTLAIYAFVLVAPSLFKTTSSDVGLLVRSLLFVPDPSSLHADGLLHPTLAVGWTLNYEMYFYVMFWVGLTISRQRAGAIAVGILSTVIVVVNLTSLDDSGFWHFYGYPIVLEFMYGIVAFHLVRYLERRNIAGWWPGAQKYVLGLGVSLGLACLAFNSELWSPSGPRWLQSGIPAFVVLVCAVLLERVHDAKITNRIAVAVGDASYVLYLLHTYVVFGIMRLVIRDRTFSEFTGQIVVLAIMAVSAAIAVAVYHYFELPMLRFLKRRILPRGPRESRAAAR